MWDANNYDDASYQSHINKIYTNDYDCVILFCHIEFEFFRIRGYKEIIKAAYEKNLKVYAIVGCIDSKNYCPEKNVMVNKTSISKNIEIIYWPTVFFREAVEQFFHPINLEKRNLTNIQQVLVDTDRINFLHHYVYLNSKGHDHRMLLIDLIAKHDLLKYSAYSWHKKYFSKPKHRYQFKHFNDMHKVLDDQFVTKVDQGFFPKEYYNSYFQLVCETTIKTIFITEKTVAPLLLGKPFLVAGSQGINNYIKSLGFELFDELFDYSFDTIPNIDDRFDKICETIRPITNIPLNKLEYSKITKEKIVHNRQKAIELAYQEIPDQIKPFAEYDYLMRQTEERLQNLKTTTKYLYDCTK